jgi:hypothetical protein
MKRAPTLRNPRLEVLDGQIAELSLLLPRPQLAALERLACSHGLAVGQLLRLVIHDYLVSRNEPVTRSTNGDAAGRRP